MKKLVLILAVCSLFMSCEDAYLITESESNDTIVTANAINVGDRNGGEITVDDQDHFSFTAAANTQYTVTAEWIAGDDFDLVIAAVYYSESSSGWYYLGSADENWAMGNESYTFNNNVSTETEIVIDFYDYLLNDTGYYTFTVTNNGAISGASLPGEEETIVTVSDALDSEANGSAYINTIK